MKTKHTLTSLAIGAAMILATAACGNKPAFERLDEAVKTLNAQSQTHTYADAPSDFTVEYQKIDNTLRITYTVEGNLDKDQKMRRAIEQGFELHAKDPAIDYLLQAQPDLAREITASDANVSVMVRGTEGGEVELIIPAEAWDQAYDAVNGQGAANEVREQAND